MRTVASGLMAAVQTQYCAVCRREFEAWMHECPTCAVRRRRGTVRVVLGLVAAVMGTLLLAYLVAVQRSGRAVRDVTAPPGEQRSPVQSKLVNMGQQRAATAKTLKDWTATIPRCSWEFGMVQEYQPSELAERWVCKLKNRPPAVFELIAEERCR